VVARRASGGQVRLRGSRIDGVGTVMRFSRLGLARSFQTSALFARLSVLDNLRCALLWPHGHNDVFCALRLDQPCGCEHYRRDHLMQLPAMLQLEAQRDTLAEQLSYADQRALELGLALAGGAQVLLLDEPTAGMSRAQAEHFVHA
jgi:branched-chain amino acid transport system ATP-binding protein